MTKEQQQVKEFMTAAGQRCPEKPILDLGNELRNLRMDLINEEFDEYDDACTLEQAADAIGDMLYVLFGLAVCHGLDMEPIFQEIHRSNMTKFIDGHKRADGKWIKGPSYSPANLKPILDEQSK